MDNEMNDSRITKNIEFYKNILINELKDFTSEQKEKLKLNLPFVISIYKLNFEKQIKKDFFLDYDVEHIQLCVPINFDDVYKMIEETITNFAGD
jgi:hypothetical protein